MTLKEKFQEWHDSPTNETVAENIIELEKIADDYAIEFAEWKDKNCYLVMGSFRKSKTLPSAYSDDVSVSSKEEFNNALKQIGLLKTIDND